MQTGHVPQGLVMGTCVYHIAHRGLGQTLGSTGQNVELPNFTQALYEARELAMTRMQDEADATGAPPASWGSASRRSRTSGARTPSSSSRSARRSPRPPGRGHAAQADHHHLPRQLMTPAAAERPSRGGRPALRRGCFSSGLSVPDFAACLDMGLEPVGLVQGFCVMQWGWYGVQGARQMMRGPIDDVGSAATRRPSGARTACAARAPLLGPELRADLGRGRLDARASPRRGARMLEEAIALGAHGVVGVVDRVTEHQRHADHRVPLVWDGGAGPGAAAPARGVPWTTYLAGQRLTKFFEAGFAPVAVVAAVSSVRVWAYCMTEYLIEGRAGSAWLVDSAPQEIEQFVTARMAARDIVRRRARAQLEGDELHGVDLEVLEREVLAGDWEVRCRCGATGCVASRISTRCPIRGRRCGCREHRGRTILPAAGPGRARPERHRLRSAQPAVRGPEPTSDLTVDEELIIHAVGWEPLEFVSGVSMVSIPWATSLWSWGQGEIEPAASAYAIAFARATERMLEDAASVGAHGVVGVSIERAVHPSPRRHHPHRHRGAADRRPRGCDRRRSSRPTCLRAISRS